MTQRPWRLGLVLALAALAADDPSKDEPRDAPVGASYKVPYRLTRTNHFLVRCKVDGKGPFFFLVDSGAPALFVGTEAARAIGLKEPGEKDDPWTPVERLDIEGGVTLTGLKARVEDVFQLVGMNAMGLPGTKIDGILGFTVLGKFRLDIDPTRDRMEWTRLDNNPKEPFLARREEGQGAPLEVQMMQMAGPAMKFMSIFIGKQPEDQFHPQGMLGLELAEADGEAVVAGVLPGTPAADAGFRKGDRLLRIGNRAAARLKFAHEAIANVRPGDRVRLLVRRGDERIDTTLTAAEGL